MNFPLHWPALIAGGALLFLVGIDAPAVRHGAVLGMGHCSLQQYAGLPAAPAFLALGSSRVRESISTETMRQAGNGRLQDSYNLGRSGLSTLRDYLLLRDLLDRGVRPGAVLVELDLDALRERSEPTPWRMPAHAAMLKYSDLGLLQQAHPELGSAAQARITVLAALAKVRGAIGAVVSGAPLRALLQALGPAPYDCRSPASARPPRLGLMQLPLRQDPAPEMPRAEPGFTSRSAAARQVLHLLQQIRALCGQHGIVLLVARQGADREPALAPPVVDALKALVPEFVQPPEDLVRSTWGRFADATHMGPDARALYSRWLAEQVLAQTQVRVAR